MGGNDGRRTSQSFPFSAGFYESPNGKKFSRVQLLTIGDLLDGKARAENPVYEPEERKPPNAAPDDARPGGSGELGTS